MYAQLAQYYDHSMSPVELQSTAPARIECIAILLI